MGDSPREEPPHHHRVGKRAEDIPQNELRAEAPPEEAKVRGVPEQRVDAVRDEEVGRLLALLDDVVEGLAALDHCRRPHELADPDHYEAEGDDQGGGVPEEGGRPGPIREEEARDETLERSASVRDGIRRPVCRQEEGIDVGGGGVEPRRAPELEEVERREGREEEGEAPEGRG